MQRASGAYKRTAQAYIAVLGLVFCAVLNVDTLMIARELCNDDAIRTAVVKQAQEQASADQAKGKCSDSLQCVAASIRATDVPPIGWARQEVRALPQRTGWLWKLFGVLISSIAVAMGAPFCFDLLNKFVNLRMTGSPPPDSRQTAASWRDIFEPCAVNGIGLIPSRIEMAKPNS